MAQYTITLTEISAEMLDELANFAHTAWGRTDILEVDVMPGMGIAETGTPQVAMTLPEPVPATSSIEVVLPPEPVDYLDDPVDETGFTQKGRKK